MKKKITFILLFLFAIAGLFPTAFSSASPNLQDAFRTNDGNNSDPLDQLADAAGYNTDNAGSQLENYISSVIKTILSILGILFMILLIYGGFLWMTDQGNTTQVEKAKKLITAAVVGLIIILLSYAISIFVFERIGAGMLETAG
jgi:hypothetical protein